jgi:hypothetical protein
MTLRTWMKITGVLLIILGVIHAVYAPLLMPLYGVAETFAPLVEDPLSRLFWTTSAFLRLFGALMLTTGIVVWFLRDVITLYERRLALGMAVGLGAAAVVSFVETVSTWNAAGGWILTTLFALLAAGFGYGALFPTVIVPAPDEIIELERDIHRHKEHPEEHHPPAGS